MTNQEVVKTFVTTGSLNEHMNWLSLIMPKSYYLVQQVVLALHLHNVPYFIDCVKVITTIPVTKDSPIIVIAITRVVPVILV